MGIFGIDTPLTLLTKKMVLNLMDIRIDANELANKASVDVREKIILLVTIQQYALQHINFLRKITP